MALMNICHVDRLDTKSLTSLDPAIVPTHTFRVICSCGCPYWEILVTIRSGKPQTLIQSVYTYLQLNHFHVTETTTQPLRDIDLFVSYTTGHNYASFQLACTDLIGSTMTDDMGMSSDRETQKHLCRQTGRVTRVSAILLIVTTTPLLHSCHAG